MLCSKAAIIVRNSQRVRGVSQEIARFFVLGIGMDFELPCQRKGVLARVSTVQ